jgi:hypothetical protein
VSFEGRQFLLKMFFNKPAPRLVAAGALLLFGFATAAMADIEPFDPHGLFANGGDATPITTTTPITLSVSGGGIFVFNNDTGAALQEVDVKIAVPDALEDNTIFTVVGGIVVPPGGGQQAFIGEGALQNSNCGPGVNTSTTTFCEELSFRLVPGPIVPAGGNFILDFDDPVNGQYQGFDAEVAAGTYDGDTMDGSGQVGSWGDSDAAFVTPIVATPEPRQYAGLLAGIMALAIAFRRRKAAVAQ